MSDTIKTLQDIVVLCGRRGDKRSADHAHECETKLYDLLERIVERAGECLEDHVKAAERRKPRKERTYRQIVDEIAVHFCDICDNPEQAFNIEVDVREILAAFDIVTTDYTGREVKIT